jgi:hypothetical protein
MLKARLFRRVSSAAMTSAPMAARRHAATEEQMCLLCDEEYDNAAQHNATATHVARFAVCQSLVSPDKHAAMMAQMWDHIRLDFDAVDTINAEKLRRRRRRLGSTLKYLRESNVLVHSVLRRAAAAPAGPSGCSVSRSFTKMAFIGEGNARFVVADRVARLFPKAAAAELSAICDTVLRRHTLEVMYGLLELDTHLPPGVVSAPGDDATPAIKPATAAVASTTDEQRASVVLAILGELHAHSSKDKPTSVAHKSQADTLVLNVLASHATDNIYSELVHHVLQKIVEEGTPVWRDHKANIAATALQSQRPAAMPLAAAASAVVAPPAADACSGLLQLEADADASGAARSLPCSPGVDWIDMRRKGLVATSVPHGKKNALFGPMTPRLLGRARPAKVSK